MPSDETAVTAEPFFGDKLYQCRARRALPILVRQASAARPITYSELANELSMPNPRNLNYVLGSVGQTLIDLATRLERDIPPIQCLVLNQRTDLPGQGVGWFIDKSDFKKLTSAQRRTIVNDQLQKIFSFRDWHSVLDALGISPLAANHSNVIAQASQFRAGGESQYHKALKELIAFTPTVVGLPKATKCGLTEFKLPSGDSLDVLFQRHDQWIAVEVKSHVSDNADIVRGMFQCIKYHAVLGGMLAGLGLRRDVRVLLAIDMRFPDALRSLRNILGVEVVELKRSGGNQRRAR